MKQSINLTLKPEVIARLNFLEKNAKKLYGKKASRSAIIETLILGTRDRLQLIKERKKELIKEINSLDDEFFYMLGRFLAYHFEFYDLINSDFFPASSQLISKY